MGCLPSKSSEPVQLNTPDLLPDPLDLMGLDPSQIQLVPYKGQKVSARVVELYDGDTFTVIFFYGSQPMKIKIRLDGVDTPELKPYKAGRTSEELELEKAAAIKIKFWVSELLLDKLILMDVIDWDKFGGRLRCRVEINNKDLSQLLIAKRWAREYHGEKKTPWTLSELNQIIHGKSS